MRGRLGQFLLRSAMRWLDSQGVDVIVCPVPSGDGVALALRDAGGPAVATLTRVVLDFSGRPYLEYRAPTGVEQIGGFSFQLVEEFLRAFAVHAGMNLHVEILYGRDAHHMAESVFKGLAKAVDQACQKDARVTGIPSTKGIL